MQTLRHEGDAPARLAANYSITPSARVSTASGGRQMNPDRILYGLEKLDNNSFPVRVL